MVINQNTHKPLCTKSWLLLLIFSLTFSGVFAQPSGKPLSADGQKGEALFNANCTSCHNMSSNGTGPALSGVTGRHSKEWLQKWIRNNEKLKAAKDPEAVAITAQYNGAQMNVFENLSEGEINTIITYLGEWVPPVVVKPVTSEGEGKFYSNTTLNILLVLIVVLVIILLILRKAKSSLKGAMADRGLGETEEHEEEDHHDDSHGGHKELTGFAKWKKRSNPTIVTLSIVATVGLIMFLYAFYFGVTEVGVQRGYAPTQPINFSHKIHAGEYKIDCKYCHTTVEKSKQASVPSVNTCFNCHKGVQARKEEYGGEISPEIKKIYAALDYDPEGAAGKQFGPNPKPVKWIRIHNLPDHAYFNHSQHVKVAGLQCQNCHGPVQTMDVLQQYATLQMGWCINCHREKGIDVEHNPYYEKLHMAAKQDIAKFGKESKYYSKDGKLFITVAQNGGLECGKCHY